MRILSLSLLVAACATPPAANVREVVVLPEKAPCVGEAALLCMQVRVDGSQDASLHYDSIDGWTHLWGTESTIRVDEQPVEEPVEDGPSVTWTHLATTRTTDRTPGESFDWLVDPSLGDFVSVSGAGGELLDGKAFICSEQAVCDALGSALDGREEIPLTFGYGDPINGPLELLRLGG